MEFNYGSQERAEQVFAGERAQSLVQALELAFDSVQGAGLLPMRFRRPASDMVWAQSVEQVDALFGPLDGVSYSVLEGQLPIWTVDDEWAVRVKCHTTDLRTINQPTGHQQLLRNGRLPGFEQLTVVQVGPVIDRTFSAIDLVMTRYIGRRLDWHLNLRDLANGNAQPLGFPQLPVAPPSISVRRPAGAPDAADEGRP